MENRKGKGRRWMAIGIACLLLAPTLAACNKNDGNDANKKHVLRIATSWGSGPDDDWFRSQFTDIYEFTHPNIDLEIQSTQDTRFMYAPPQNPDDKPKDPLDTLKEMMDSPTPPDVVMVQYDQLGDLIQENRLKPLDPFIQKDKFDTSDFVPALIDGLKSQAPDNKLYALAPTFNASALWYNKKIFNDAGVPYPTDGMTWDQVFDLAKRVTSGEGENKIYGFSFNRYPYSDLFNDMNQYIAPLNLRMFDDKAEHMTVDTAGWEQAWQTMVDLKKQGIFPDPEEMQKAMMKRKTQAAAGDQPMNPFATDPFMNGHLAMAIINNSQINEISQANKNAANIKGFEPLDWDIVTLPTHPEAPNVGGYMYMNGIASINAKAQNPDDAWDFISFINGKDWVKLKSKSVNMLVSRKEFNQPIDGLNYNVGAFFKLTPAPQIVDNSLYRDKPNLWQVQNIGQQKMQQVLNGDKTVKQALEEWQNEGNAMLEQIKQNPNGPIDIPNETLPAGKG